MAYLGFGKGGSWRARRARAYNEGLGAEPPAGPRGRSPGRGSGGRSPLKLKRFLLLNVQRKPQIRPFFSEIRKRRKSQRQTSYQMQSHMAILITYCIGMKKDHQTLFNFAILAWKRQKRTFSYKVAFKNFHGRAKGGHRTVALPLNTPLLAV